MAVLKGAPEALHRAHMQAACSGVMQQLQSGVAAGVAAVMALAAEPGSRMQVTPVGSSLSTSVGDAHKKDLPKDLPIHCCSMVQCMIRRRSQSGNSLFQATLYSWSNTSDPFVTWAWLASESCMTAAATLCAQSLHNCGPTSILDSSCHPVQNHLTCCGATSILDSSCHPVHTQPPRRWLHKPNTGRPQGGRLGWPPFSFRLAESSSQDQDGAAVSPGFSSSVGHDAGSGCPQSQVHTQAPVACTIAPNTKSDGQPVHMQAPVACNAGPKSQRTTASQYTGKPSRLHLCFKSTEKEYAASQALAADAMQTRHLGAAGAGEVAASPMLAASVSSASESGCSEPESAPSSWSRPRRTLLRRWRRRAALERTGAPCSACCRAPWGGASACRCERQRQGALTADLRGNMCAELRWRLLVSSLLSKGGQLMLNVSKPDGAGKAMVGLGIEPMSPSGW